jgi:hypothetical protein
MIVGLFLLNFNVQGDTDDTYVVLSNHASLSAALTSIGSNQKTLVVDRNETISTDVTIPANVSLKFGRPYILTVNTGIELTISSSVTAKPAQIFSGAGTVSLVDSTQTEVFPHWFYDGAGDWTEAIQAAIDSGISNYGLEIVFPRQDYTVTGTITLREGTRLRGVGPQNNGYASNTPLIRHTPSTSGAHLFILESRPLSYISCIQVENMAFGGNSSSGDCFYLDYPRQFSFTNLLIRDFENGISILGGANNKITQCSIKSEQAAFRMRGGATSTTTTIEKCNLREAQWGAILESSQTSGSLHTIFFDTIIESNTSGGIDIHEGNQDVNIINCYSENNPTTAIAAPIIQVGVNGSSNLLASVNIIGGVYSGINSGSFHADSTFLNVDVASFANVYGCQVNRVGKLIATTDDTMKISVLGVMCNQVTNISSGIADWSRFVGELPTAAIASGSYPINFQTSMLTFNSSTATKWDVRASYSGTNPDLLWRVNNTEKLRFDANGQVGIGTTPKARLHSTGSTILGAPTSAISSINIGNSQVNIYLDESGGNFKFKIRKSNGNFETATVPFD